MLDTALIAALNHLLDGASWARKRLEPFAGRHACFVMPPLQLAFTIGADGLFAPCIDATRPDVTIRLPADTPFLLPRGLDKVMAGASVAGNAEFATELSFIFRHLHWDVEEDLARMVGDIPAHRLVNGASRFAAWQKQAAGNLAENLVEYLTQENSLLVSTYDFVTFRDNIARLSTDLDRLEVRCKSLA
jgi:ubiquinone biosynthesis protein UbiJ